MMLSVHQSSLFWKLVLPVPITLVFVVALTVLFLPDYLADSARQGAIYSAKQTAEQFKTLRGYYTTNVIKKVLADGNLVPSFNHKTMKKGIPLPATFIHDMSELLETKGVLVKLTSPFPFPNRNKRKLDSFQKAAWDFLKDNPKDVFVRAEMLNGREFVRVGIADTMVSQACVDCHNSRADSPKSDWNVGDLRGVLEIKADIGTQLARGVTINQTIIMISLFIGAGLTLITIFTVRKISKPIKTMTGIMEKMAIGITDLEIPAQDRKDEVGAIANAVEVFRNGIIEQKRLQAQIQLSEDRYRDFANSSSDWFWEMGSDLRFTYVSGRSEEVLGLSFDDVIGKRREDVHQGNLDKGSPTWKQHLSRISDHLPFSEYEFHWRRPDGGERYISLSGAPRFDENGNFMGYRGVGRDISKRKLLEKQIRRSQKMEAIGQLTGGIAHDFNNILGIIQGNLELIKDMVSEDRKTLDRINKAFEGVKRGIDITKKLLGFSRKKAEHIRVISANVFVKNLQELIAKSLTASINVETQLAEDLWTVAIDPGDLEDAILNLSLNARDAMPDGGTLIIETANKRLDKDQVDPNSESRAGEYVMISISDTGLGISPEVKGKVLEPFFTTKEQGKGTGLGLSMVYGFIKRSNGYLKIYSEIGQGTTIRLFLPRTHGLVSDQDSMTIKPVGLPRGSETILVVEDEEVLRNIAVSHLEDLGYQTLTAENGKVALQVLKKNHTIDLLFSDVVMPGQLDGYQLALLAHEANPSLKILLTSGFTKIHEDILRGDDEYSSTLINNMLNKPYKRSELATALRYSLDEGT